MTKFNSIQTFFLKRDYKKRLGKQLRHKQFYNLSTAKSFGIIFDASKESNYIRVSSFVRHLQAQNKAVKAIGYVSYKELPHYIMPAISYDFILRKELNIILKPTSVHVSDFIKKEVDVLVDFNMENNPILHYVSGLSMAKFKIGLFNEMNKEVFDFMLQGIEKDNMAGYAKEVLHYLEILQPNNN